MTVLVHSSMRSLGWVVGGTQAVIQALTLVLGESGTLVMPSFACNSDPRDWRSPPIAESWWQVVRVGSAPSRLMSQRDLVDFAAHWIRAHRR